ncbi:hypothetical protein Hdeb2414_s0007g00245691 [Helianthus debilis subsp. tardiflorus]
MVYSPVRLNIGIWIREYIQEVGHTDKLVLKTLISYLGSIELCVKISVDRYIDNLDKLF